MEQTKKEKKTYEDKLLAAYRDVHGWEQKCPIQNCTAVWLLCHGGNAEGHINCEDSFCCEFCSSEYCNKHIKEFTWDDIKDSHVDAGPFDDSLYICNKCYITEKKTL